jgi:uncharacterized MnhB-related membrane protein
MHSREQKQGSMEKYTLCYYLILFLTILSACLSIVYQQSEVLLGNVAKPAEE